MTYFSSTARSADHDIRLVVARQLVWDREIWRSPGRLNLSIRLLENMQETEEMTDQQRAEVEMLIRKLYAAGKKPAEAF